MSDALIGVVGVIFGAVLGGTGKYWTARRDAWKEARASGLLLLADVRALRAAPSSNAQVVVDTGLGVKTWESHRQVLAGFRRGAFPNGFKAAGWLTLAGSFARLKELDLEREKQGNDAWWHAVQNELSEAERLLQRFENDPRVVLYTIRNALRMEPDPDKDHADQERDRV